MVSKILTKSFTTILSQFPIKIANFLILGKPLVFLMVSGGIKKLKIKLLNNFLELVIVNSKSSCKQPMLWLLLEAIRLTPANLNQLRGSAHLYNYHYQPDNGISLCAVHAIYNSQTNGLTKLLYSLEI